MHQNSAITERSYKSIIVHFYLCYLHVKYFTRRHQQRYRRQQFDFCVSIKTIWIRLICVCIEHFTVIVCTCVCWGTGQHRWRHKKCVISMFMLLHVAIASYIYNNQAGKRRQRLKLFPTFNLVLLLVTLFHSTNIALLCFASLWCCLRHTHLTSELQFIFSGNYFADIYLAVSFGKFDVSILVVHFI